VIGLTILAPMAAMAGTAGGPNPFGLQDRAEAGSKMVVLGVQQAISSLPPTSGQALSYIFDPALGTFVDSELLGPTSFRSTQLVGPGNFSFRFATSYFELSDDFGPVSYLFENQVTGSRLGYGRFAFAASAKVAVFDFAMSYGVAERLEVTFNLPVTRVDATARQSFTARAATFDGFPPDPSCPPANCTDLPPQDAIVSGAGTEEGVDALLGEPLELPNGDRNPNALRYRTETLEALGADFNEGTSSGVGRISIGARVLLLTSDWVSLAMQPEIFFPSPSEDEFAGSNSLGLLPRIVVQVTPLEHLWLHGDAGYEYDSETKKLQRAVWNTGVSLPFGKFSVDAGVGGSEYRRELDWTPKIIQSEAAGIFPALIGTRQSDAGIGGSFIDFLAGFKIGILSKTVLSGNVTVPLNGDGFRADVTGTLAIEQYY
jgi:hypothetical protein